MQKTPNKSGDRQRKFRDRQRKMQRKPKQIWMSDEESRFVQSILKEYRDHPPGIFQATITKSEARLPDEPEPQDEDTLAPGSVARDSIGSDV